MGNGIEGLKFQASTRKAKVVVNKRQGASGIVFGCSPSRVRGGKKKVSAPAPVIKHEVPKCIIRKGSSTEIVADESASNQIIVDPQLNYHGWAIKSEVVTSYGHTNHLSARTSVDKKGMITLSTYHAAKPFCPKGSDRLSGYSSTSYPVYIWAAKDKSKEVVCRTEITVKQPSEETLKGIKGCVKKVKPKCKWGKRRGRCKPRPPRSTGSNAIGSERDTLRVSPVKTKAPVKTKGDDDMFEL